MAKSGPEVEAFDFCHIAGEMDGSHFSCFDTSGRCSNCQPYHRAKHLDLVHSGLASSSVQGEGGRAGGLEKARGGGRYLESCVLFPMSFGKLGQINANIRKDWATSIHKARHNPRDVHGLLLRAVGCR